MFYLFHGDDAHSQKEYLDRLLKKQGDPAILDLNTSRFEGIMPFRELRQTCDSMPFLAPVRIVICNDLFKSKPQKEFSNQLFDYLPNLPNSTRLIFLESQALSEKHKMRKIAREADGGYEKLFNRPDGSKLQHWIRERTEQKSGRISPHAAHVLAISVGNDLQILDNELEKLVNYKGQEESAVIESADVELLSPYVVEASIFDLVDALGNRNGKRASLLLQQKLNEGADPFYLFSMVVRQFRLLIQVKELADDGLRPTAISRELRLHSFVVGKLYQQARGFDIQELERIYYHLLEIDVAAKTGEGDMQTSLELLLANVTRTT